MDIVLLRIILIFIILFLPACTTVTVEQADGTRWSYTSFRDLENVNFEFEKSKEGLKVRVTVDKVSTEIAGKIAEGAVKGAIMGIKP